MGMGGIETKPKINFTGENQFEIIFA